LVVINADTLDQGLDIINRNKYGNGAAMFTSSGESARKFERNIEAGQVGINVPIVSSSPGMSVETAADRTCTASLNSLFRCPW
jgi:malonate-semialdehyde dehydrogenase (acetylating)/methylmalonate-semialdehyde dehydrogenase